MYPLDLSFERNFKKKITPSEAVEAKLDFTPGYDFATHFMNPTLDAISQSLPSATTNSSIALESGLACVIKQSGQRLNRHVGGQPSRDDVTDGEC